MNDKTLRETMRYVRAIPRELPEGIVLVHNSVLPRQRFRTGMRGFRAWTQKFDGRRLEVCPCDWAGADLHGLVHYRVRQAVVRSVASSAGLRMGGLLLLVSLFIASAAPAAAQSKACQQKHPTWKAYDCERVTQKKIWIPFRRKSCLQH